MPLKDLSDEEKNILLQLSYLDIPLSVKISRDSPKSIEFVLKEIRGNKIEVDKTRLENIENFLQKNKNSSLHDIKLIDYQNHNPNNANNSGGENSETKSESGFVGYALKDQEGDRAILFRGSENPLDWDNLKTDWWGNLQAGIGIVTKQHEEANNYYKKILRILMARLLFMDIPKVEILIPTCFSKISKTM
jgi:hypothetical protein